jgi:hypothetical protein
VSRAPILGPTGGRGRSPEPERIPGWPRLAGSPGRLMVDRPGRRAQTDRDPARPPGPSAFAGRGDALVVIWDGNEVQGPGGTGEVVAKARAGDKPIAWVHAGNRSPGTAEPTTLGEEQGRVTFENM